MHVTWAIARTLSVTALIVVLMFPVAILLIYSVTESTQLRQVIDAISNIHAEHTFFKARLDFSTLIQIGTESRKFSIALLNSIQYSVLTTAGQLVLALPAAIALSALRVTGRYFIIPMYLIIMMMPFQVTLVPNFLILHAVGLLDSVLAIMLPLWFWPFSVIMLYLFMIQIPTELYEAARTDGAGTFQLVRQIIFPLVKHGLWSIGLLHLIDSWNMIEQPLVFLTTTDLMPLSIMIRQSIEQSIVNMFAPAVLFLLPILIIYSMYYRHIIYGLQISLTGAASKAL